MSELNKNRLTEIEYKKCLTELLDFCLYGECLQEETAKDYFEFLVTTGMKQINWKIKNQYKKNDEIDQVNTKRFNTELNRIKNTDNYEKAGYFEGKTFSEFRKEFKSILRNQKNIQKHLQNSIIEVFDLYCSRFVKNINDPRKSTEFITPSFREKVKWKGMEKDDDIKFTTSI